MTQASADFLHGCRIDRKKPHPVIRMEDVLNPGRCETLSNLIDNMAQRLSTLQRQQSVDNAYNKDGVWYNIPVAMNRDSHLKSEVHWNKMMQRLRNQVCTLANRKPEGSPDNHWHVDIFPASKQFVVYHVLKVHDEQRRKLMKLDAVNNRDYDEQNELDIGLPAADPIYHMYIECSPNPRKDEEGGEYPTVAGRNLQFMDVMYNRWAVQNGSILRKRILERKADEIVQELGAKIQNETLSNGSSAARRGEMTQRAIAASRMVARKT